MALVMLAALMLLLMLLANACNVQENNGVIEMKKITFKTSDNVLIYGNLWDGGNKGILLLHMMPATKESWNDFAGALNKAGFSVLAIDLRGHGESISQDSKTLNFRHFNDEQHQESIRDVEASVDYMRSNKIDEIYIAGASIGANLALQYQADHNNIMKTILLSPGINYRGVLTEPFATKLKKEQAVYFAAGSLDGSGPNSAGNMAEKIASKASAIKKVKILNTNAHGTDLFKYDKTLIDELVQWLST